MNRQAVIEALAYPCKLLRNELEAENCPFDGEYRGDARRCRICPEGLACHWLLVHEDPIGSAAAETDQQLAAALQFAIVSVDAQVVALGHSSRYCRCDSCTWLRGAHKLYEQVTPPPGAA